MAQTPRAFRLTKPCQPLFDAMGQRSFVIGEKPSSANLIKLCGNFLIASMLESLGETFALVRKSGVDSHRYLEIPTNTLFSAWERGLYGRRQKHVEINHIHWRAALALCAASIIDEAMAQSSARSDHQGHGRQA